MDLSVMQMPVVQSYSILRSRLVDAVERDPNKLNSVALLDIPLSNHNFDSIV